MTFIGVLFNSQDLTLSVTPERVKEILELVNIWLLKSTATLKELQSLIGKLSFIASCVHSSRIFIARLLNSILVAVNSREAVCSASSISYNKGPDVVETVFESFLMAFP